ncbi:MAG TPA: ATPase [Firmicutes bacterium]|nr:ATPase [Bacillota bacterium]
MIFKRKIYDKLLDWKKNWSDKRALLVQGARRIGKSTIVEEFAKNEYETYILINFQKDINKVESLLKYDISDLDSFFRSLSLIYGTRLIPRKTLIIFDEVQLFPLARQSIKQLVEDGRYDYIETGSLITLKQNVENILIPSEEKRINMYPMDFEEFLWAKGDFVTCSILKTLFEKLEPLGQAAHRRVMRDYMLYVAVGGMPQAVNELLETNDFSRVDEVKRDILNLYRDDLKKLDAKNRFSTSLILNAVPSELSTKSKMFRSVALGKNARVTRAYSSYEAIKDSMIVNIANNCKDPNVGFNLTKDYGKQKIYMGDTGLLVTAIFEDSNKPIEESIYKQLIIDKLQVNTGMIMENAVAQTLVSLGYDLYFHTFDRYELDFMLSSGKKLIPIEVKSSSYMSHKSLDMFEAKYSDRIKTSYVIYGKDIKRKGNVTFIPFYMAMFL